MSYTTDVLDVFLFAEDMAKGASTEEKMKKKKKKMWINHTIHVIAMLSQSASKRLMWYISHHLESLTKSLPSEWKDNDYKRRQAHIPWKHIVKSCA